MGGPFPVCGALMLNRAEMVDRNSTISVVPPVAEPFLRKQEGNWA